MLELLLLENMFAANKDGHTGNANHEHDIYGVLLINVLTSESVLATYSSQKCTFDTLVDFMGLKP